MARTTLDIDDPILKELKRLQRRMGRSLGRVASDLLADALSRASRERPRKPFRWYSQAMGALIDLEDKEAVQDILDRDVVEKLRR
jgi:hypothetical protein